MRTYPLGSPGRVEDGRGSLGHAATIVGVCRLIANHLHLAFFESTPEVRALPSAGITRLQRSYYPVRLPPMLNTGSLLLIFVAIAVSFIPHDMMPQDRLAAHRSVAIRPIPGNAR